jgi:hypothetical protein
VTWEVEFTDQFGEWWEMLSEAEQDAIAAVVEILQEQGPGLRRPLVGPIEMSRHRNLKELIPPAGNIRILFAFDPRRVAILLIGGDKTDRWDEWYEETVPVADDLYDEHLKELAREERNR